MDHTIMASSNKVPHKRLRGTWCQCLLPDSGFDHPDYPSSSCFMNTICENKTQLIKALHCACYFTNTLSYVVL